MDQNQNLVAPGAPQEQLDNRVLRRRMLKKAVASYNDQAISTEVLLRDMSDTGVKIKIKENDLIPDHFHLYVELDGIEVDCEVVWRRGLEIGARFVSDVKSKIPLRSQAVVSTRIGEKKPSILRKKPIQP